ncbi:MAG: hypothetical protein NXH83_15100 [Rhodobacteraceae bacterium]|nr:hypothetical protein [Paracoccaceae bacterium]
MNALDHYARTLRMSAIVNAIKEAGLDVEIGTDFVRYRRIRKSQIADRPIYPMFDSASSYVDASNGFWIAGFDEEGALIHTQAMRLLPLGDATLAEHLAEHRLKYVTPGLVADPEEASYHIDTVAGQIAGRVCYHGEFWLAGGARSLRGGGVIALLSRLAFELAEATWGPDYVFGFVDARHALTGTPARHCYFHGAPGTWQTRDGAVFAEEWLVWMSARDIAALTASPFDASHRVLETVSKRRETRRNESEVASVVVQKPVSVM